MTSQPTEQKVWTGVKNNETIGKVYHLFIRLRLLLTNPEDINDNCSPTTIFDELTNICIHLADRKYSNPADAGDIFEIILKNYLLLLDTNEFVGIIISRYLLANNDFLSSFYQLTQTSACAECEDGEKMYFRLLNQISSSTRLITFLKNENNIKQPIDNSCRIILIMIFQALGYIHDIGIELSIIKLKKYQNTLFIPLITFIDEYISTNKTSENNILINRILEYFQQTSKHILTIPILININCLQICLKWLSLSYLNREEYEYIMGIFYNMTRHDEGAAILDKPECRKILHQFKNEILNIKFGFMIWKDTYKELCFITDILIILSEYSGNMCNEYDMIRYNLLPTITIAFNSFTFKYNDVDVVDLLIILMKLFNDDNIVNYVLEKYKISAFFVDFVKGISTLIGENDLVTWNEDKMSLSLIVLVNILWSISFQDQYKNDLIQDIDVYKHLKHEVFQILLHLVIYFH